MKIYEIDDIDRTWAKSTGINLDIDTEYKEAIEIFRLLNLSKSANRNNYWLRGINEIENNLQTILNANLSNDPSTSELKNKATKYLLEIQRLKGLL